MDVKSVKKKTFMKSIWLHNDKSKTRKRSQSADPFTIYLPSTKTEMKY